MGPDLYCHAFLVWHSRGEPTDVKDIVPMHAVVDEIRVRPWPAAITLTFYANIACVEDQEALPSELVVSMASSGHDEPKRFRIGGAPWPAQIRTAVWMRHSRKFIVEDEGRRRFVLLADGEPIGFFSLNIVADEPSGVDRPI